MKSSAKKSDRLTWSQKATRLRMRLRDPEWRRYGKMLLFGKLFGVCLVLFGMIIVPKLVAEVPRMFGTMAYAADTDAKTPDTKATDSKAADGKAADTKAGRRQSARCESV